MQQDLNKLLESVKGAINDAADLTLLEGIRVQYLGKKGKLTELLKGVSQLPKEQRPEMGKAVNLAKNEVVNLLTEQQQRLEQLALDKRLKQEVIDVTLPGRGQDTGQLHPVSRVRRRVVDLFSSLGFSEVEGPEIEDDFHNFTALNIPSHHPARAEQDTFYLPGDLLLRTHTSSVQIRTMQQQQPPLRIITPGRVYRCDSDQTHTPMFHQLEGLVVDQDCTFSDLKGLLHHFFNCFFETDIQLRFRPSYFPFTEPSAEVDIRRLDDKGKPIGDWLEVLGCGMVHPNVLKQVNIDPEQYTGYAFGLGLDRLAMLRYNIPDLRMMFENDVRFLEQF